MITETLETDFDLTEIINGEESMGPSPFDKHQDVVFNLADIIRRHVRSNKLGKVYLSPLDVIFEEGINRVQPDILFVRKENLSIVRGWVRGVPDMVCEIVSPWSYERDTLVKRDIYERYKVPEYWIVLPEFMSVQILTVENDKYKLHSVAAIEGFVTSKVIEGLQVNITEVFE
ncbi:Uma2 family endonuclease [Candidatus Magnetomonas plexicatena]|uniref:Uma2 family endonuclease n=1 Tax=Candidatus Magnetomonas plexicatena TaxID=2552947 RepID=UPI00110435E3|nr:Uma2 family endonuclease [Nitrospirales bacterium LBB_01]